MKKKILIVLFFCFIHYSNFSQCIIRGHVISKNDSLGVPLCTIILDDHLEYKADINGDFQITVEKVGKSCKLLFKFIGFYILTIESIPLNSADLNIGDIELAEYAIHDDCNFFVLNKKGNKVDKKTTAKLQQECYEKLAKTTEEESKVRIKFNDKIYYSIDSKIKIE
jgi:hypothetical protein